MGNELIEGVIFDPLPVINTTGGKVLHAIKGLDAGLPAFGECYFSTASLNDPKAWKKHSLMICNIFVPYGAIKFVFYDDRQDSKDYGRTTEFILSGENYGRLIIKPGVWFGFVGIAPGESVILNVANILHDPAESVRLEPGAEAIPYTWNLTDNR